ncbi:thioredoxin family protein [Bacillus cytotoxicus]|uniref:thioredoxin family protein n=1 Tax=Bacillus cytotoxicus TaxID=580165 RepID=UPI000B364354|nr:thioredoxin family protein [Bacillus cytotoxicus]AWC30381.1 thioredoxin [Bacillus cytotoxicus]AWC42521.1 thioredoxin [Bacillus cytotoxicus]AWC50452.1 thioredoxin [Bacillus cytotoxicus]AWC54507.1 thioredoxin [Bacillus cytotoxicus]AWC58631.1 thioredoxin [Bacillus cytotoxicus]
MIEVIDWTGAEAANLIVNQEKTVLYVYTPMCGTCQLAKKMLTVVEATIVDLEVGMLDLNYAPHLAREYEIESVPCLLIFENGTLKKKIYAFHSVEYLYKELQ